MENIAHSSAQCKLFHPVVKSDFGDFLHEILNFWDQTPSIRADFEADLRAAALESKHMRARQQEELPEEVLLLEGLGYRDNGPVACSMDLSVGRPRMPAKLVFAFCMIRGWIGSVCSAEAENFMRESLSLSLLLEQMNMKLPGKTTILENINAIQPKTLERAHTLQLGSIKEAGLDCFSTTTIDSTSVEASSGWPTDSKILYKLSRRVLRALQKLDHFGLDPVHCRCSERWLENIRRLDFQIALVQGKSNARKKRRQAYRELYLNACKLLEKQMGHLRGLLESVESVKMTPLLK